MLSIASSSLSFAGPSALPLARAVPVITMQEGGPPPVFSVIEDQVPMPDPEFDANAFAQTLPGITGPLGFFDPAGFCSNDNGAEGTATEGKVRFYREVEVKHCRVAMLAALGYPLAEVFHPLFGGAIDGPSFSAFQQTPLQTFWPAVVFTIAVIEVLSILPAFEDPNVEGWAMKTTHSPGDLGFDPLGLEAQGFAGPQDDADQGDQQRTPRHDRLRGHRRPGARHRPAPLLESGVVGLR